MRNIPSLTGLRFIAAFLVISAHTIHAFIPKTSFLYVFISRLSGEGMTLFFVLSGFVIHYNYSMSIQTNPKNGLYNFYVSRFARLIPLYTFCFILDLILTSRHSTQPLSLKALPYYLTLTQTWFYVLIGNNHLIYQYGRMAEVSWSISTEWFFYLCYPFICYWLLKTSKIKTKFILLVIITIITILYVMFISTHLIAINNYAIQTYGLAADYLTHTQDSFFRWLIYFSPYSRVSEFLFGCFVASIYLHGDFNRNYWFGLSLTALAIFSIITSHYLIWDTPTLPWISQLHRCFGFAPAFGLLIFCCAYYSNFLTNIFATRFLILGGEISYSIYLLHIQIIAHTQQIRVTNPIISFVMILCLICIAAFTTYQLIEVPGRRFLRQLILKPESSPIHLKS